MTRRARVAAAVAGLLVAAAGVASAEPPFEISSPVSAERYLSAELMSGEEWQVEPAAANNGFTNSYTLNSRFGSWEARGRAGVVQRIQEIRALAVLDEVSKTDVFLDAVESSVTAPLRLAADVADRPVETLKGVPSGVGRWFKKTRFKIEENYHDAKQWNEERRAKDQGEGDEGNEEDADEGLDERAAEAARGYARGYLKVTGAERRWYAELGVDPYTDNQVLREAVTSVARVEGLTKFGMRFTALPSIPGSSEIRKTLDLVWTTDPWELRLRNRKMLLQAGISEEVARELEDNRAMSLTLQTAFLNTLAALDGVAGRQHLLARALDLETRPEAQWLVASIALLHRVHQQQAPLAAFLAGTRLPIAQTEDGRLVGVMLADAVFWTEEVATAAGGLDEVYADVEARERLLLVVGEVSAATKKGLSTLGWTVRDRWQPPPAGEAETGTR